MHAPQTRSFKSLVARPLFSIFICVWKKWSTQVANQHKHLIVNGHAMLLYKLFMDIMYLKITYNL